MKASELIDHTQCGLRRWYYGNGKTRFADLRTFSELEAVHARAHDIGREIENPAVKRRAMRCSICTGNWNPRVSARSR